ncbi:MAG: hypothetical protein JNJ54_34930 [Myxococcaceae bacterium]|nr:hypothetical protein [Myxococcaceae bacterium]
MRTYRPLVALTLWQPWAWAITAGLKRVENRGWRPLPGLAQPGTVIAIHAAVRQADWEDVAFVRELAVRAGRGLEVPRVFVHGAITAVATLDGVVTSRDELERDQQPWWVGPLGWVLRDVRPLRVPLACRGQQGLWPVSGELVHQVWDQLEPRGAQPGGAA